MAGGDPYLPTTMHKLLAEYFYPYAFESDGDPQLTTNKIDKERYTVYILMLFVIYCLEKCIILFCRLLLIC
jgi:hypothetical protein